MTTIVVTAAIIARDGRFLVTRRLPNTHLAGQWEFPGGKCIPGESLEACMMRELKEELNVAATVQNEVFSTTHEYPDRRVELHFFRCAIDGNPEPLLRQEMRWIRRQDLNPEEFPPADAELIQGLIANSPKIVDVQALGE